MLSDVALQAMADLIELDSNPGCAPIRMRDGWAPTDTTKATAVLQPAKRLNDLPQEVLKIVFEYVFTHRELLFVGFLGVNPILQSPSDAWPLQFLRVSSSLFNVAREACDEAIDDSVLIYDSCLPPFPYQGNDFMYAELGKDDSITSHFVHEKFLKQYGPSFREVEILGLHHRGQPNLQPFTHLKSLTVGTIVISRTCTKANGMAWEDYFYALYHDELLHWTRYAEFNQPYYFCGLIVDDERGYNIRLKLKTRCACHGWWRGVIDVEGKKAVEVEQVEGTADQALNSL